MTRGDLIRIAFNLCVIVGCVSVCACNERERVHVTDHAGKSIQDVEIRASPVGFQAPVFRTDKKGEARIRKLPPDARFLEVSKPGYRTFHVQLPAQWPLRVKLKPKALNP